MRKSGIIIMLLGAVLILSALLLIIHNKKEDEDAGEASYEAVSEIKEAIRRAANGEAYDTPEPGASGEPEISPIPGMSGDPFATPGPEETPNGGADANPGSTAGPTAAPAMTDDPYAGHVDPYNEEAVQRSYEMPTVRIHGYDYIGYITIPAIKLELPVMADWDYVRLKIAPCRHLGSYKSGDLIIAGHNFERHFGNIYKLGHGDLLILTTADGKLRTYLCTQVLIIEPTEIDRMQAGDWDLTLYTCTYGGRHRITVRFTEVPVDSIDISRYI